MRAARVRYYLVTTAETDPLGDVTENTFVLAGQHPTVYLANRIKWLRTLGHETHAALRFYRPISVETFNEVESVLIAPRMVLPL